MALSGTFTIRSNLGNNTYLTPAPAFSRDAPVLGQELAAGAAPEQWRIIYKEADTFTIRHGPEDRDYIYQRNVSLRIASDLRTTAASFAIEKTSDGAWRFREPGVKDLDVWTLSNIGEPVKLALDENLPGQRWTLTKLD